MNTTHDDLSFNILDYSKWWDTICDILMNRNDFDANELLSPILKNATSKLYRHPLVKNTRVLVVMGKENPKKILPYFQNALDCGSTNLTDAAIMEVNALSKLYFDELIPLYIQIFEGDNLNAQWLAVLNLLNLMKIYPSEVSVFLNKFLLIYKESSNDTLQIVDREELFNLGKKTLLTQNEFCSIFEKADDKQQWAITLNLIDYAKKYTENIEDYFLTVAKSNNHNVRWSVLLGTMRLIKTHPDLFGKLLTKILLLNQSTASFSHQRVLVEIGKNQKHLSSVIEVLDRAIHGNSPYLKWTAISELIAISQFLSQQ